MSEAEKLELCSGCRNDFYNDHNQMGIKRCWLIDRAVKVKRTKVGIWQNPPYKWQPQSTLSCHEPQGMAWLGKNDPRVVESCGEVNADVRAELTRHDAEMKALNERLAKSYSEMEATP